jgi:hypothetical protein
MSRLCSSSIGCSNSSRTTRVPPGCRWSAAPRSNASASAWSVPRRRCWCLTVTIDELKAFALDQVSGFLLSLADGSLTVEAILDASGLPRLLALRHLRGLVDRGLLAPRRATGGRRFLWRRRRGPTARIRSGAIRASASRRSR